jgi:hypothetical protein
LRRPGEATATFSAATLLGHDAGIEQDAEVLRDGQLGHLECPASAVTERAVSKHPAPCRMADCYEDVGLAIGNQPSSASPWFRKDGESGGDLRCVATEQETGPGNRLQLSAS